MLSLLRDGERDMTINHWTWGSLSFSFSLSLCNSLLVGQEIGFCVTVVFLTVIYLICILKPDRTQIDF